MANQPTCEKSFRLANIIGKENAHKLGEIMNRIMNEASNEFSDNELFEICDKGQTPLFTYSEAPKFFQRIMIQKFLDASSLEGQKDLAERYKIPGVFYVYGSRNRTR